jgi:FkbM family methyltransferase
MLFFVIGFLAIGWIAIAVSNKARLFVAKNYFKHEQPEWTARLATIGVLRPVRMQVEPGVSMNLDPRDLVSASILRSHSWQPEVWDSLNSRLAPGAVLIDVGAHIGIFSLKGAARVGPTGRVISFEPNPETLVELRSNVAASHADQIVTVEPIACSDKDQQLTLYAAHVWNTGASSLSKENAGAFDEAPKAYPVRARPIDDVVAELGLKRVDAIKIDVEGAEVSVLRGALKTLQKFHPKVVIEIDERQLAAFATKPEDVVALFHQVGYRNSRRVDDTDWEWFCLCPENTMADVRMSNMAASDQLVKGFYSIEDGTWRWTAKDFEIALAVPKSVKPTLNLELVVPQVLLDQVGGSTTLHARVGTTELAPQTFNTAGSFTYTRELPPHTDGVVDVDFSVDKAIPPKGADPRILGLVVVGAAIR